jgi:predicted RNA-binding protein YlxR (DUF448 family)
MKHIPMRRCLGCGKSFPKESLIRIIKTDDTNIIIDSKQKVDGKGKGGYICCDSKCLKMAVKKNAIKRFFRLDDADELISRLDNEINGNE